MYLPSWFLSLPIKVSSALMWSISTAPRLNPKPTNILFVWRKTVERNRTRLMDKIRILLEQVDEAIAQENSKKTHPWSLLPAGSLT